MSSSSNYDDRRMSRGNASEADTACDVIRAADAELSADQDSDAELIGEPITVTEAGRLVAAGAEVVDGFDPAVEAAADEPDGDGEVEVPDTAVAATETAPSSDRVDGWDIGGSDILPTPDPNDQGLDKLDDPGATAVGRQGDTSKPSGKRRAKTAKPGGKQKDDVPLAWATYAICLAKCVASGEGFRANLYSHLSDVQRLCELAQSEEADFRDFWRRQHKQKLPTVLSKLHLAILKKVSPDVGRRTRSSYATALLDARESGIGPDHLAAWLGEKGGIEARVNEYRKRHPRIAGGRTSVLKTRLVVSGVPDLRDGRVQLTVEVIDGKARYIGQAPAEMIPASPADPVAPPSGGGGDQPRAENAPDGLDAGAPPSVGHQAQDVRRGSENAPAAFTTEGEVP